MRLKGVLFYIVVALCLFTGAGKSYASHIYGGELLYRYLSGNSYEITLTLYGDCSSFIATGSSSLFQTRPKIFIYNNGAYFTELTLKADTLTLGQEVSPVCPEKLNQTTCHMGGFLPGVRKFVFTDTVVLPVASANWKFVFSGNLGITSAGRSEGITNAGNSNMQIEATLNNTGGHNSSPVYSTIPTPFYCLLADQQYNQGAIDANGDSLSFALVGAISGNTGAVLASDPVSYLPGYSGSSPLSTEIDGFQFSELNGQLTFTPNLVQKSLVVCRVSEYRGGVLVGTSQREMTFIVSADCDVTPPSLNLKNVNGGVVTGKNVINICTGTAQVSFDITINNPDGDTTYITPKNVPGGAVLNLYNNSTPNPSLDFAWDTDSLPAGVYTFFLDVKNNHCPIANRQTVAYTINVTPYPSISATQLSATDCIHEAYVEYNLALGYLPRYLTIKQGGDTIANYKDTTGIIQDSLAAGEYTLLVGSHPLCQITKVFNLVDSGKLPISPITKEYCKGSQSAPIVVPTHSLWSIITWYDANNNVLPIAPTPSTKEVATYKWYIREQYKTCISDLAEVQAIIHPLPDVKVLTNPSKICYGDTLFLEATGGVAYEWAPANKVLYANSIPFARLTAPGSFKVIAITEHGCKDSSGVTFGKVEQCCRFGYPTAFTPNNDGKNDGFKIISFGHTYGYKLAVYNRWGQMVYLSYNPKDYWDGTCNNVACDPGTYYYFFEGTCLTGVSESYKGDVTLIR